MIMNLMKFNDENCRTEAESWINYRSRVPELTEKIIKSCEDKDSFIHIDYEPMPSRTKVINIIRSVMEILYPGYFSRKKIDPLNFQYNLGQLASSLFDSLTKQIITSVRHECSKYNVPCTNCVSIGHEAALSVFDQIPEIKKILATDIKATYDGDPAAKSYDEIIFSYPGIYAISVYRIAHILYQHEVPYLPRIMSEYAHTLTGIDIHPGATIGSSFAIDHGTGVVIGETSQIGNNVRIYQGVTLGALSLPKNAGEDFKGKKRHPTIEDNAIIYSGATILGGETIIGKNSVVGGNVWLTESIPPDTKVLIDKPKLIYR